MTRFQNHIEGLKWKNWGGKSREIMGATKLLMIIDTE